MFKANEVNHQLFEAVRNGQLSKVQEFIDLYGLPWPCWLDGYALLCEAIQHKRRGVAISLLRNGSEVNSEDGNPCMTPLHYAVENNDVEVVKMLLNKGAHLDIKASDGSTPLFIALLRKNLHIIYLLLNHGAAFDVASTSWAETDETLLHFACANGHKNLVDLLLGRHADVNAKDRHGSTPLHVAAKSENLEVVKYLLIHGADVNAKNLKNQTPLSLAVDKDSLTIVRNILSYKPDSSDEFNRLILCSAVKATQISRYHSGRLFIKRISKQIVEVLLGYGFAIKPHDVADSSLLYAAVENGYEQIVENLLIYGADVNYSETTAGGKSSLLHTAVKEGQNSIVQLLIKYGADVNSKDKTGHTPIYLAIQKKNVDIALQLLDNKAVFGSSFDLLCLAIETKNTKTVEKMLSFDDVDINATNNSGTTALHFAIQNGQTERSKEDQNSIVQLLIKYGADINSKDETGRTPLYLANQNKNVGIAIQLLDNEAFVESSFDLLRLAIETENTKTVKKMLSFNSVDINATNNLGKTALHFAIQHGQTERSKEDQNSIVQLLIKYGADVNRKDEGGRTPLYLAIQHKNVGIAIQLLDNEAFVESSFDLLRLAIETENTKTFEKMLSFNGVDINATNNNKITALHIATEHGQTEMVQLFLDKGVNINNDPTNGETALFKACQKGYSEIVEILLKFGAKSEFEGTRYAIPLHAAIRNNSKKVVEILLRHDADINFKNDEGETALQIASSRGNEDIVDILLEHGSDINVIPKNMYSEFNFISRTSGKIINHFERHMIKLTAANLYDNEENLRLMDSSAYKDFRTNCEKEIQNMKSEKIVDNISFYNILTKGMDKLTVLLRNKNIMQVLTANEYRTKFPIYGRMIYLRSKKGVRRKDLLEQSYGFFKILSDSHPVFPHDCIDNICNYLSNYDLRMLANTCE